MKMVHTYKNCSIKTMKESIMKEKNIREKFFCIGICHGKIKA